MAANQRESAQLSLITPDSNRKPGRRKTGRHERAFDAAVKHERMTSDHRLDAALSLGRGLAAGLDRAELSGATGYELAQLGREYREHLRVLGLLPTVQLVGQADGGADPLDFGGAE